MSQLLSRTPPVFSVGSLDPLMKRARSGSISKRLRNAAEMAEESQIDKESQGVLKDMIIRDDPRLQHAMRRIEERDPQVIKDMMADGTIAAARKQSVDLMGDYGDLNFDFLNVADDEDVVGAGSMPGSLRDGGFMSADVDHFEFAFNEEEPSPMDSAQSSSLHGPKSNPRSIAAPRGGSRGGLGQAHGHQHGRSGLPPRPMSEAQDIKPLPVRTRDSRTASFNQPMPELFDLNLFDEFAPTNVSYSPMSHSPSRSLGSLGGIHSGSQSRPLHRDSIAQLEDLLLPRGSGGVGSFNSANESLDGSENGLSPPLGMPIPLRSRVSSLGAASLGSAVSAADSVRSGRGRGVAVPVKNEQQAPSQPLQQQQQQQAQTQQLQQQQHLAGPLVSLQAQQKPAAAGASAAGGTAVAPGVRSGGSAAGGVGGFAADGSAATGTSQMSMMELNSTVTPQTGYIGGYSPESRRRRIEKFLQKRNNRVWMKRVKYDVRKNFADSRLRVKGRFVRKEDEQWLREALAWTC